MLGLDDAIATETSVAGVTDNIVLPDMLPTVAVIVVAPGDTSVASPFDPATLLIVAAERDEEFQVTDAVIFWVELSE